MSETQFTDEYWMELAYEQAALAAEQGEIPVGAVIVSQNQVIGRGYNAPISLNDPTAHAEIVALREACAQLGLLPEDCLYMGDDWPDLSAFAIAGMKVNVPNGHVEVRRRADLVTQSMGGRGAVREVCDILLNAKGVYQELLEKYLAVPH